MVNLRKQADVPQYMRFTRCTVQGGKGNFCDAPASEEAPFPICVKHLTEAYRAVRDRIMDLRDEDPLFASLIAVGGIEALHREPEKPMRAHIYYLQVGELLKIGYTERLRQRINNYPPNRRLLAVEEDGTYEMERARLVEFREYLVSGKEWFKPGPRLIDHVNKLRRQAGAKPIVRFMPDAA